MRKSLIRKIRNHVKRILKNVSIYEAPIDVESVAASLGIEVMKTPTEEDLSGFLLKHKEGPTVIGVNMLHHPNRQRFTVGHEIGHFLLHHHDEVHVDRVFVKLRDGKSGAGTHHEEIEANRFAAELLMPKDFLIKDMQTIAVIELLDDRGMQKLARKYQVSVQAMTNRLITLGILDPGDFGPTEY